jgi:hypothetical protein
MDLPVNFRNKVTLPKSANGTGYPYRISATDIDKNFAYAALDADESWIESTNVGGHNGRKLKLPPLPSGEGVYILSVSNGTFGWSLWQELSVSICENNYEKTGTILFRES